MRKLIFLPIVVFLASIIIGATLTQATTGLLTESRGDALATTLGSNQNSDGSFPSFLSLQNETGDAYQTALVLQIARVLGALDRINLPKAADYIISKQNLTTQSGTLWGWPFKLLDENSNASAGDLGGVYFILSTLRSLNLLDRVNKPALAAFALSRYNSSDGGFYEPVINVRIPDGSVIPLTPMGFPVDFRSATLTAYSRSNMISTFLGVSVLAILGDLGRINDTLTQQWILDSQTLNGAFGPFPNSSTTGSNPFNVDQFGAGLAYTFAAISSLKTLGYTRTGALNYNKVSEFVLQCQDTSLPQSLGITRFLAYPGDLSTTSVHYSYYAVSALSLIGKLTAEIGIKVSNYLLSYLQAPSLRFVDSWPIPSRFGIDYGLFTDFPPLRETYFSVLILNATGNLNKLEQLTPITAAAYINILSLSGIATGIAVAGLALYTTFLRSTRKQQA